MDKQFCFPLGFYLDIFVAFIIKNPKISFKDQFRCQLQIVSSLLINPSLRPSGVSCDVWDLSLSPWQDACEKHLLIFGVLLRMARRLCLCPFGYWVVAASTACPTSLFVAEGWGLWGRGPVSSHHVGLCILSLSLLLAFWNERAYPGTRIAPALCSLHRAYSQESVSDWVKFKSYIVSGKRAYWKIAVRV